MPDNQTTAIRIVGCPRCHEQCGWCSDYRWMHAKVGLPGTSGAKCRVKGFEPEGDACPICSGSKRVRATTTYEAVAA